MLNIRKVFGSMFVMAAAAAVAFAPAAVAQPHGSGGPDGNGGGTGCARDSGWQGCGGFQPGQGGFGRGCIGNICGSWDGARGWFVG